jgi:hypothetical protein
MSKNKKIGFDLKTHIRDAKGKVIRENAYRLVINNGVYEFERPKFSGNWYAADGSLIRASKKQAEAPAKQVKEINQDELLAKLAQLEAENEALKSEKEEAAAQEDAVLNELPPAEELDNSEELALIEQAKVSEASKPLFKAPSFLGGKNG